MTREELIERARCLSRQVDGTFVNVLCSIEDYQRLGMYGEVTAAVADMGLSVRFRDYRGWAESPPESRVVTKFLIRPTYNLRRGELDFDGPIPDKADYEIEAEIDRLIGVLETRRNDRKGVTK